MSIVRGPGSARHAVKVYGAAFQVYGADDILEGRHKGFPAFLADDVNVVAAGVNDVRHHAHCEAISGIHRQTLDFKPVVLAGGQGREPVARNDNLIVPQVLCFGRVS